VDGLCHLGIWPSFFAARASSGVAHHIDRVNLRQNESFHLKEVYSLKRGGNVYQLSKVHLDNAELADLMSVDEQIASGMAYLFSKRCVHLSPLPACRNCVVNQLHKGSTPKGSPGISLVFSVFRFPTLG